MFISRVPLRISLLGGGTDLPHFFTQYGHGYTLGFTFNSYVSIICERVYFQNSFKYRLSYRNTEDVAHAGEIRHPIFRELLRKVELPGSYHFSSKSSLPGRSGLGSSSAFTVGLIDVLQRLNGVDLPSDELARLAIKIEREDLNEPGGYQDQHMVSNAGLMFLTFSTVGTRVEKIDLNNSVQLLNSKLYLVHTSLFRNSAMVEKNKTMSQEQFSELTEMAKEGHRMFATDSFDPIIFGKLLNRNWQIKKSLSAAVSNPQISDLMQLLSSYPIFGAKLCGAGSGGAALVLADPNVIEKISLDWDINFLKVSIDFGGIIRM
jgi:D-glycero-alpha-D-manno-heptose-7-phosphate kinase